MDNIQILEQIKSYNPWHSNESRQFSTEKKSRDLFDTLVNSYLDQDISISISGLRRVGKTTILHQLINYFLQQGINPQKIFYFQFNAESKDLATTLQLFFDKFSISELQQDNFYILLDELQNIKSWQNTLKHYIDRNKKIKFIVTGSTSIYAQKNIESLAGRIIDFRLAPLSFDEFLRLGYGYQSQFNLRKIFLSSYNLETKKMLDELLYQKINYRKYFQVYLSFGEYPALLNSLDNTLFATTYLKKSILEKILEKDIKIFEIKKEKEVRDLFRIACANSAQSINYREISRQTAISYYHIKEKFNILEKIYLVDLVKNHLSSIRSQIGSQDKVFCNSLNLLNATLNIDDPLNPTHTAFRGHVIETYVYNAIKSLGQVFYFLKNKKEVDLILEIKNKIIPIEVKSKNKLKKTDLNHLFFYMKKNKLAVGYVVYGGDIIKVEKEDMTVYAFPYWLL